LPDTGVRRFNPVAAGPLTFEPVRQDVFRAFRAGMVAARAGGTAPAVFNAANEVAVAAFLAGRVPFGRIYEIIERVLEAHTVSAPLTLEAVTGADQWARAKTHEVLSS
jgi:1-deoxy-D-xylulose-5-phosphate reductoisomerase